MGRKRLGEKHSSPVVVNGQAAINLHLPVELLERVNRLCERQGLARAAFCRRAIEVTLDRAEKALKDVPTLDELIR